MNLSKYYELAKSDFLERWSHAYNQIFSALFVSAILFIFYQMWTAIYAGEQTIAGYTIAQMVWYLAFAELMTFAGGTTLIETMGEDVKTGNVVTTLLKPISYIGQKFALYLGKFIHDFFILGALIALTAYLLVGSITVSAWHFPLIIIAALCGGILNFAFVAIIGLFAFWFEDTNAFGWIYQKSNFILGGMLVPLDVYPVWLQEIVKSLPFSYMMYLPSKLFVSFNMDLFWSTIAGQLAWFIVALVFLFVTYKIAIKKVNVHGG